MTTTRETTIAQLTEGDTVLAINGKARPFPYVVARVMHQAKITRVDFAHGGLIPWCDSKTVVTVPA